MAYNLQKLFAEIDARLSEKPRISLKELSAILAVNRQTVEMAIRKVAGASFRQHQKTRLLERAILLLTQKGSLSSKEIATILGYETQAGFSRFIKFATGKSPGQTRRDGSEFGLD